MTTSLTEDYDKVQAVLHAIPFSCHSCAFLVSCDNLGTGDRLPKCD